MPGRVPRDASETINLPLFDLGEDYLGVFTLMIHLLV